MGKKQKVTRSEIDGVNYRTSSMWRIALSQAGNATVMSMFVITSYVTYMANAAYGIATAVVGVLLTCFSIFDGFTDPLAAKIVDNTRTKHGKIRILLLVGWACVSAALFLLYNVLSTGNFGIVTFIILYALYFLGYSVLDVTQRAIGPIMTNDPSQRPIIGLWSTIYSFVTPIVLMTYVTIGLLPKYNNEYTVDMLKEVCILGIIVAFMAVVLACIGVSKVDNMELFDSLNKSDEKISFADMFKMLKNNKAFQIFIIAVTSDRIALLASGQAVVTTMLYGILLGDMQKATLIGTAAQFIAVIFAFFGAKHVAKHGSKESMLFWTIVQMITAIITMAFYMAVGIDKILASTVLTVIYAVLAIGRSGFNMCCTTTTSAMTGDIVDYQNYLTGKYMPAAVTATYSFIDKCIAASGTAIALGLVSLAGYKNTMPQPGDTATPAIYWITMFIMFILPIIGWIISIIALKFTPINKEKMVELQSEIAKRQ